MSQDLEKYLTFHVGLLKNSFALDALWQDALKYHMIDQPGKLIALRLTEYYEMMARGFLSPSASASIATTSTGTNNGGSIGGLTAGSFIGINAASPMAHQEDGDHLEVEDIVIASPDLEQNADEAAEYWARL
jgi:hypothetical protein